MNKFDLNKLVRPNIRALQPYSSARDEFFGLDQDFVQLDANENPYGDGLNRYPDPYQRKLRNLIAKDKAMDARNLLLGNGSDEVIDLVIRTFCEPGRDEVLSIRPTYGMYKVVCDINGVGYQEVNLSEEFSLNEHKILDAIDPLKTKLIFICSPNNPTGNSFDFSQIKTIIEDFNGLVIVDEAYIDFSEKKSLINSLDKYPQLVVLQTFSKSYGMAGIRLGMAWASREIIAILNKIKPPYNVNQLTINKGVEVMEDKENHLSELKALRSAREKVENFLVEMPITVKVFPSDANFLLVRFKEAKKVYDHLLKNKIIVRDRSNQFNCENCLRISIGTETENNKLMNTLKQL